MAAVQRKLVHKQFNSPMGLYSQENVKATLNRELKAFGGEGIEVDDQISKPLNLANSAVLRAVEEEEQQVKCGYKRVAWPPASEERIIREFTPQPQSQSPAPGSGGYYPQQQAAAAVPVAPAATAPPSVQGPIYNNVQPRTQPPPPTTTTATNQPRLDQQNGYTQHTPSVPSQNQVQASYPNEQPIQYTQAQFNRQPSREPSNVPHTYTQQQQQPQPQQQQHHQQQQQQPQQQYQPQGTHEPIYAVDNAGGGWKHIGAPLPKSQYEFTAGGATPGATTYPPFQQQQQQQQQQPYQPYLQQPPQHQHQQQQQPPQQQPPQQQQYGAPTYNNYQQQPQQQQQQQQQQQHAAPGPQWQQQPPQQQYQAPYQVPAQQSVPQWAHQQPAYQASPYQQQQQPPAQQYPQQNGGSNYAQPQYNSYSQPQHQPYSQDQTDLQQQQQSIPYAGQDSYRGASPGIITLRKEAPVSQQPAPVYTSQPAAVSYQGGSKLRGDLKWPPPEYKEAAARENEERRQLALGPVCRPRRVNRDYTNFFAQHQLNNAYPSYKVPPGTQHMFA
ncbi:bromodomain-containing protein DDB_G0280777 isoform X1 [Drosophila tropicalis]|uniref:bromodomain-containing protein DDB_G0280777 isoform X1 n=1 Tax=Drosophila tropicalis TaxID=46794 RepID=UPI0035AB75D3